MLNSHLPPLGETSPVTKALLDLVCQVPVSREPLSADPKSRARMIARASSIKVAGISGALSLPPGPLGLATIIPDLLAIWRLQQAMVADIAATFGKTGYLRQEAMIFCLFKHGSAALMRDLVVRVGERLFIRRVAIESIQLTLQKVGVTMSRRLIGKVLSRWIPLAGAVGMGAYAYYDTAKVAATAIELFASNLEIEAPKSEPAPALADLP